MEHLNGVIDIDINNKNNDITCIICLEESTPNNIIKLFKCNASDIEYFNKCNVSLLHEKCFMEYIYKYNSKCLNCNSNNLIFQLDGRPVPEQFECIISNNNDNNLTYSRVIVLRKFDQKKMTLRFNTDYRSPKIIELKKNNKSNFVFYDAKIKIQLRISTLTKIHYNNEITLEAWEQTRLFSRKCI